MSDRYPVPGYMQDMLPEGRESSDRRVIAGVAAAALVIGGGVAAYLSQGHEGHGEPRRDLAPHELVVAGSIDMGEVSRQVLPTVSPADTKVDSGGVRVIELSEYTPVLGVSSTNGQVEFTGIPKVAVPGLEEKLDQIVAADAGILNVLAENDSLGAIRFNMAVDPHDPELEGLPGGDMRFLPAGNDRGLPTAAVLEFTLPATGEVSEQFAATMVGHEATHVAQRRLDVVDKGSEIERIMLGDPVHVDIEAYRSDIAAIRQATIETAQQDPKVIAAAERVARLNAHAKTAVGKAAYQIAKEILDGTLNNLQPTRDNPSGMGLRIEEGRLQLPWDVELNNSGLTAEQLARATAEQKKAMEGLDDAFNEAIEAPNSPLALFDESSYTGSSPNYGHPRANTAELIGGAENALRTYPKRLAQRLKKLSPLVQKTVLRLLRRVNDDTARACAINDSSSEANRELHERTHSSLEWIERQVSGQ